MGGLILKRSSFQGKWILETILSGFRIPNDDDSEISSPEFPIVCWSNCAWGYLNRAAQLETPSDLRDYHQIETTYDS